MFHVNFTYLCPHSPTPCTAGKQMVLLPQFLSDLIMFGLFERAWAYA